MYKKIVALVMCLCLCAGSAFAAYGSVFCDLQTGTDNSLYWAEDGTLKLLNRVRCKATSIDQNTSASDIVNIYAKASYIEETTGAVYVVAESLDHYVTKTSATTDYVEWKEEDPSPALYPLGISRARYIDDSVSEHIVDWSGNSYSRMTSESMNQAEFTFGRGASFEVNTHKIIEEEFSKDLSEYNYVAFCDIWTSNAGTLSPDLSPLKSILSDIFVAAQKGDYLPFGILYKGTSAYTLQELASGDYQLTEYTIGVNAVVACSQDSDAFHNDYSIANVTVN